MSQHPRVSIVRCRGYGAAEVEAAVGRSLELLGGIQTFVEEGDRVLIKPNLLSARPPESCVDTHPAVVRAVVRLVKKAKALPVVGDSPGGVVRAEDVYERSGIKKVAVEEGAELVKFDQVKEIEGIPIATSALDADLVISLPKLKTHDLFPITGAVKNILGVVPGIFKTKLHLLFPTPKDFAHLLAKIFSWISPKLSIMDAVRAMEGRGPAAGDPRDLGLILASSDAVALDACASYIVGLVPSDLLTTKEAHQRGLGKGDLAEIEIVGESIDEVRVRDFRFPRISLWHKAPGPILRSVTRFVKFRPTIDPDKCTGCKICLESCPVGAIEFRRGKSTFDYKKCILCLCCHEFCPQGAIYIRENILGKAIRT